MRWDKVLTLSVSLCGVAFCTAATAQPLIRRPIIEASYSPNDALSRSVAHIAVASTNLKTRDAQLSQADLFSLMIVLSLSKKNP